MKKYLIVINLLFINIIYSQNFDFKTSYTLGKNEIFLEENFKFSFTKETSIFKFVDSDLDIKNSFKIKFLKSDYSDDGNFYIMSYSYVNRIKYHDITYDTYPFVIINYDKKIGQVSHITILYYSEGNKKPKNERVYFTEYGKKYYAEKYFSKQ